MNFPTIICQIRSLWISTVFSSCRLLTRPISTAGDEIGVAATNRALKWTYDSYMKAFKGNQAHYLDSFDCKNADAIAEYYNFEPGRILQILIEKAMAENISPNDFHKEMKLLIKSKIAATDRNRKKEQEMKTGKKQLNESKEILEYAQELNNTVSTLEKRYDVKSAGNELDSVTLSRIRFIFAHHTIEYQKNLHYKIHGDYDTHIGFIRDKESLFGSRAIYAPFVFSIPEFAAIIPIGRILKEEIRDGLITLHLYCTEFQNRPRESVNIPPRTHQIFLKRKIYSSLLSDERKVAFLELNGILKENGELRNQTEIAIDYIRKHELDFMHNIFWSLLK